MTDYAGNDEDVEGPSFEARELQRSLGLDQGYRPEDVGQALDVNVTTVYRWLHSGLLDGMQFGKQWRVTVDDVRAFVHRQENERKRLRTAQEELRRIKKLRPDRKWRIENCAMCDAPLVTDGGSSPTGQSLVRYSADGEEFFACPVGCYGALSARLAYDEPPVEI